MSVTFRVEIGTVSFEKNHNNMRACDLMKRAGLVMGQDLCGEIKHEELLPAIQRLLNLYREARQALEDYMNHSTNSTNISFSEAEYYEFAAQGLIGVFSLAYTLGKDVYYS